LTVYKEIIDKINEVVQPDIHAKKMARKHFQYLYAVKANVNETIDFLRQLYSEVIDKIRDHISELAEQNELSLKMIHSARLGYHIFLKKTPDQEIPKDFEIVSLIKDSLIGSQLGIEKFCFNKALNRFQFEPKMFQK
jgi:hypothetical protein